MPRDFKSELEEGRASQDQVLVQLVLDQLADLLREIEDELAVVGGLGPMLGQVDRLAELDPPTTATGTIGERVRSATSTNPPRPKRCSR